MTFSRMTLSLKDQLAKNVSKHNPNVALKEPNRAYWGPKVAQRGQKSQISDQKRPNVAKKRQIFSFRSPTTSLNWRGTPLTTGVSLFVPSMVRGTLSEMSTYPLPCRYSKSYVGVCLCLAYNLIHVYTIV
jgi:hypothetical protein